MIFAQFVRRLGQVKGNRRLDLWRRVSVYMGLASGGWLRDSSQRRRQRRRRPTSDGLSSDYSGVAHAIYAVDHRAAGTGVKERRRKVWIRIPGRTQNGLRDRPALWSSNAATVYPSHRWVCPVTAKASAPLILPSAYPWRGTARTPYWTYSDQDWLWAFYKPDEEISSFGNHLR